MICPECRADQLLVQDSRPRPDTVYRRRECLVCGNRFTTMEISLNDYKRLNDYKKMATQLNALMDACRKVMEGDKHGGNI